MSRLIHHKKITAVAVIALLMAAAGAYAYWTQGRKRVAGPRRPVPRPHPSRSRKRSTVTALAPGAAPQALSGTISNPNAGYCARHQRHGNRPGTFLTGRMRSGRFPDQQPCGHGQRRRDHGHASQLVRTHDPDAQHGCQPGQFARSRSIPVSYTSP